MVLTSLVTVIRGPALAAATVGSKAVRRLVVTCVVMVAAVAGGVAGPEPVYAAAVTIYVSPSGSDAAAGTPGAPIRTLGQAQVRVRQALASGSSPVAVELSGGTYALAASLLMDERDSGSSAAPVTWRAAAGAAPVIAGGRTLAPTWTVSSGQVRVATVGSGINADQLFVNGTRQILARYPNYDATKRLGGFASDAIAPSRVSRWATPTTAQVRGLHLNEWGGNSYRVTGKNGDGSLVLAWVGDNQRGSGLHATYRMVENVFEELDAPGEWFYDRNSGRLYYWPPSNVDLNTATVSIAELDELIRVQGASAASPAHDITFTGLTFSRTHRTLFDSTFEPISLSDWAIVRKAAVALKNSQRIAVVSSTFDQAGGNAVFIDGYAANNTVRDSTFTGTGASAIAIVGAENSARQASTWGREVRTMTDTTPGPANENYPRDITVANNQITNLGVFEKQSAGVEISRAARVTVSHNTIHDGPRAAVNIGDGTFGGHRIANNDIWNMVKETGDHGPVNSWGRDRFWPINGATDAQRKTWSSLDMLAPNVIENNRIWHNSEWAVDLDDGSSNYMVRGNVFLNAGTKFREGFNRTSTSNIYANGGAHFHVSYASNGDTVTSNIFLTGTPYHFIQADPANSGISHDRNVFFNNGNPISFSPYGSTLTAWQNAKNQDRNSAVADPLFTGASPFADPAKKDWTLQSSSPALSRGFTQIPMDFGRPGSTESPPPLSWAAQGPIVTRESLAEPWLGAQITGIYSDALASSVGLSGRDGIYLQSVPSGSAAAAAGLRAADVIQRVNGTTITQKNSFWALWNQLAAGSPVQLSVWRNQASASIMLTRPGGTEKINNTSGVVYGGTGWGWRAAAAGGAGSYLDDLDASTTSGDSYTLTFHGTRLTMITQTNSDETSLQVRVDGGTAQTVNLNTPSRMYQVQVFDTGPLTAGLHTITATSTNNQYFIVDAFQITRPGATGATLVNNTDSSISYTGTWALSSNRGFGDYLNDVQYTTANGAAVTYTFTGTGIDLITEKNSDQGNIDIYLDGVLQQTVSTTNPTRLAQQTVYSKTWPAAGSHTIRAVKKDGTYMLLDAFRIQP